MAQAVNDSVINDNSILRNRQTPVIVQNLVIPLKASSFEIHLLPPGGYHINLEAPSSVWVTSLNDSKQELNHKVIESNQDSLTVQFFFPQLFKASTLTVEGTLYVCSEGDTAICYIVPFLFHCQIAVGGNDKHVPILTFKVPVPK
jgi:hypothetical protein